MSKKLNEDDYFRADDFGFTIKKARGQPAPLPLFERVVIPSGIVIGWNTHNPNWKIIGASLLDLLGAALTPRSRAGAVYELGRNYFYYPLLSKRIGSPFFGGEIDEELCKACPCMKLQKNKLPKYVSIQASSKGKNSKNNYYKLELGKDSDGTKVFCSVHQLILWGSQGVIANDHEVLHLCDYKDCISPLHLSVGTHVDNLSQGSATKRKRLSLSPRQKSVLWVN